MQARNRLRWHLHELDPQLDPVARGLRSVRRFDELADWPAARPSGVTVRIAAELLADIKALALSIRDLERELDRQRQPVPLRSVLRHARRRRSRPRLLRPNRPDRHRLARGGNRRLNAALHHIALTQMRPEGPGREYYQRRRAGGDSHNDAMRALKRRLTRAVFGLLERDTSAATGTLPPEA